MKNYILFIAALVLINGCKYINTKEKYLGAQESQPLTIPETVDSPNTISSLEIPQAALPATGQSREPKPPGMPLRTRESDEGGLRIINEGGFPVLIVKTEKAFMWEAMNKLEIDDWNKQSADEQNCVVMLEYTDKAANRRKKANFIKKIFTKKRPYSDYSGSYTLSCSEKGDTTQVKFAAQDGTAATNFIADSVMNKLYEQFE